MNIIAERNAVRRLVNVFTVVTLALAFFHAGQQLNAAPADAKEVAREAAWQKVQQRLRSAREKILKAAEAQEKEINDFFKEAKGKTRDFGEKVLSLEGKWTYLVSNSSAYRSFLREEYEKILKPDDLRKLLERVTKQFTQELTAIENEMLVAIQADLDDADLPQGAIPAFDRDEAFAKQIKEMVQGVEQLMAKNLQETAAKEITSFALGDVAATLALRVTVAAATRLGISSTVLGVAAGSTWATLGVGLVAGIAVDYLLDLVLQALGYDPAEDLAAEVRKGLEQLRRSLLETDREHFQIMEALFQHEGQDPDADVRLACWQARGQIGRSGTLGLVLTLTYQGVHRQAVCEAALERLVLGTSEGAKSLVAGPVEGRKARTVAEAKDEARKLLRRIGEPSADAKTILRVLSSRSPENRIVAAQAAALFYGRAVDDAPGTDSQRGFGIRVDSGGSGGYGIRVDTDSVGTHRLDPTPVPEGFIKGGQK